MNIEHKTFTFYSKRIIPILYVCMNVYCSAVSASVHSQPPLKLLQIQNTWTHVPGHLLRELPTRWNIFIMMQSKE